MLTEQTDYDQINEIGKQIAAFRNDDEELLVVSFGTHAGVAGCQPGYITVTVTKKGQEATSSALRLGDAVTMARHKVNQMIEKKNA